MRIVIHMIILAILGAAIIRQVLKEFEKIDKGE